MRPLRRAALVAVTLLSPAYFAAPLSAQLRVPAPNSQTPINSIPQRRGALCDPCIIRAYDGGFARLTFDDVAPQRGDLRIRATLTVDRDDEIFAPNGQGGTEVVRISSLGLSPDVVRRRVNARVVLTATNPNTGQSSRNVLSVSASSDDPVSTVMISGTTWTDMQRRFDEVGNATQVYNEYKFQVAEIIWESVDLGGIRYVDDAIRRRLAARASAAEQEASTTGGGAAASTGTGTAAGTATGSTTGSTSTGTSGSTAGSSTSSGSTTPTSRLPAQRPTTPSGQDSATAAREAEARRQGVEMIEGPQRQAEATRRQREAQAAATAAAAVVAVSLLADLMPDGNFSTIGIGGLGGTNGGGFYLDGGPGWRLTPRNSPKHVAISVPSLILGFNSPSFGNFDTYYRETGDPGPVTRPASVSPSFSIGVGGNFYVDLPLNRTALNVSSYYLWGGEHTVEPADEGSSGAWLLRGELVKAIPTPRAYTRYGTEWAFGLGLGLQSQRVSWDDSNGTNNKARLGPFLSLRFLMVNN